MKKINGELVEEMVKVGIGVFIVRDGKILLGKRKNAHGSGTWALVGGHLEFGETFEQCAMRESMEEAGIRIRNISVVSATNDIFHDEKKHYITVFVRSDFQSGDVQNLEPDKLEKWEWFSLDELPTPLFTPIVNLLRLEPNIKQKVLEK